MDLATMVHPRPVSNQLQDDSASSGSTARDGSSTSSADTATKNDAPLPPFVALSPLISSATSRSTTTTSPSLPSSSATVCRRCASTSEVSRKRERVVSAPSNEQTSPLSTPAQRILQPVAPPSEANALEPRFLLWDKIWLEICITACRLAIWFRKWPVLGDFFRRMTLLSGAFDTNASLCMFLRYLYTFLPAPLNFDSKERYFAGMFLENQYHMFTFVIRKLGLRFLPPLLRPIYKSYYARAIGASDFIERCIRERGVTQIVILGAGFDTNAYRSRSMRIVRKNGALLRNVAVFELDLPRVQKFKLDIMRKEMSPADFHHYTEGVHFVPIDFASSQVVDVLLADGFNPAEPTALLWEGVTYYLPYQALKATLRDLQRLAGLQRKALGITEPGQLQPLWLFMDYMLQTETVEKGHTSSDRIWRLATLQAAALGTSFVTGLKDVVHELSPYDLCVLNHVYCDDIATSLFANAPESMRVLIEKNTTYGHNEPYLNLVECVFVDGGKLVLSEP